MSIAKIENGVVVQVDRTTNTPPAGWAICDDTVAPGMLWNGSEFETPLPSPPAPAWSTLTFLERFTLAERIAIRQAAAGATQEALELADWFDLLRAAGDVKSDDARTVAGMAVLVAAGLLSSTRRDEILGG